MTDPPASPGPSKRTRSDDKAVASAGSSTTPTAKSRSRGKKSKRKGAEAAMSANPIDLTFDEDDEPSTPSHPSTLASSIGAQAEAGPSRSSSYRQAQASSTYTPTAFTPLPRSILSGANINFSPEPASPDNKVDETQVAASPKATQRPALTGDVFIEENPREPEQLPGEDGGNHFEPPGLFSTPLTPTLNENGGQTIVELRKGNSSPKKGKGKEVESASDGGLLLPTHVLVDSHLGVGGNDHDGDESHAGDDAGNDDDAMEGVHFVDDDISKGSRRYFDPDDGQPQEVEATFLATADQSKICQNCKRPGHRSKDCKHIICTTCGAEDQHERRDCPVGLVCFGCGTRGHRKQDCPDPQSRNSKRTGCDLCGSWDHMENTCPTIWRVYSYRSIEKRRGLQQERSLAVGWEKEAVGGAPGEQWCYNCAREGHLGDDCRERRGSLARLTVPSAFSHEMASRGPFAAGSSRSRGRLPIASDAPATHARWADSDSEPEALPYVTGGYKAFGGSNAGKKSREKARAATKAAYKDDSDDEPCWFDSPRDQSRRGMSIRGGGGRGRGASTPVQRGGAKRPWDSEYRERDNGRRGDRGRYSNRSRSRSPPRRGDRDDRPSSFSHSHLMTSPRKGNDRDQSRRPATPLSAPAKVISFGELSAPGSAAVDSPSAQAGRSSGNASATSKRSAASTLVNRALGLNGGGPNTPRNKGKGGNASPLGSGSGPAIPSPAMSEGGDTPTGPGSAGSKKKRKRNRDREGDGPEKDWESEWRRGGNGGGNVGDWGKEFDKGDKGLKIKGRSSANTSGGDGTGGAPSSSLLNRIGGTPNSTGNGQGKAKSKGNSGQRYHGGY